MSRSLRHALSVAPAAARHPRQALVFAGVRIRRRRDGRRPPFSLTDYPQLRRTRAEAIEELLGVGGEAQAALLADAAFPEQLSFDDGAWTSRAPWIELLYLLVRIGRPRQVVETGVQWGYSTATILAALPENGRLDSIDLPNLDRRSRANHAAAVPAQRRGGWSLHVGDTRKLLPRVAAAKSPVDLMIHDADHTYAGLMSELQAAWPALAPGGLIAVDGVWSSALVEFASDVNLPGPLLIERAGDGDALGVTRRPFRD